MSYWDALDQKGSMRVLLTLLENGEKNITELRQIEGVGLNALYNVLEGLKSIDLVVERTGGFRARLFSLSSKGTRIAKYIKSIKEDFEQS